jgi:hypothetical protein
MFGTTAKYGGPKKGAEHNTSSTASRSLPNKTIDNMPDAKKIRVHTEDPNNSTPNNSKWMHSNKYNCKKSTKICPESSSWYSHIGTKLTKDTHVTIALKLKTTNYIIHRAFHISYAMFSSLAGPERTRSK